LRRASATGSSRRLGWRGRALTYLGFAAPYLLTLAHGLAGYSSLLLITAVLASADRIEDAGRGPARRTRLVSRFTPSR